MEPTHLACGSALLLLVLRRFTVSAGGKWNRRGVNAWYVGDRGYGLAGETSSASSLPEKGDGHGERRLAGAGVSAYLTR
jgi:hypothetical protein